MKFTESALEQAIIELFIAEGYTHVSGESIARSMDDVLIRADLRGYLLGRYSDLTIHEIDSIIHQMETLSSGALYESNRSILGWIADGIILKRDDRSQKDLFIELIDYERPETNAFKIVNQMEVQGSERRIPDGIVYINGLPLVVLEFKSAITESTTIADAYTQLTVRYRRDIPEIFKYNALCVISDGVNTRAGSLFATYDFFYSWRKVDGSESVERDGIDSLLTMVQGLFNKVRLIDVIRNFVYFPDSAKGESKIVCRYPQYYAARRLLTNVYQARRPEGDGRGGTYFWATGCGKSYTMLYLTRLLMRDPRFANPTIIIITDRTDLDDQLSGQFTGAKRFIGDNTVVSVESRNALRDSLQGHKNGGVFLTTIHKFTEATGLLSDRANIVCISDEAHRSQINLDQQVKVTAHGVEKRFGFAKYLHDSLPNATYVGFTGTPVDGTIEVFGPVVDAYTMQESVADKITVPIVYEGRAARVLLDNSKLREIERYYDACAESGSSEYQIEESKKSVVQMDAILGDPDRIRAIAADFVSHYEERLTEGVSVKGKVMFVSSSRPIAYALYREILALRPQWAEIRAHDEWVILSEKDKREIKPTAKISLIMTRGKDDPRELYDAIGPQEDKKELDRQFKNALSNFKIAIVVDMWLTGFDVPFLDAIYIDKPLQQHSLIQTISRVNRVYEGKEAGLVVDYIGIKSHMNLALKQYGTIDNGNFTDIDKAVTLVKDHLDLIDKLFHHFDATGYFRGTPLQKLTALNRAAEYIQSTGDLEKRFMVLSKKLRSAYSLCSSSQEITEEEKDRAHFYFAVRAIIHKLTKWEAPDTAQMNARVREMITEAIISEGVESIFALGKESEKTSNIFSDEYLASIEKIKLPNTKIKLLQYLLSQAIGEYKKTNKIQALDFSKKLNDLVQRYNERKEAEALAHDVLDEVAGQFSDLFKAVQKDRESFIGMGIDFEEKAFYDILRSIAEKYKFEYPHEKLITLAKAVKEIVDDKSKYAGWAQRGAIKDELKMDLILVLADHGYPPVTKDDVFKEIFEQAENFKKYRNA